MHATLYKHTTQRETLSLTATQAMKAIRKGSTVEVKTDALVSEAMSLQGAEGRKDKGEGAAISYQTYDHAAYAEWHLNNHAS